MRFTALFSASIAVLLATILTTPKVASAQQLTLEEQVEVVEGIYTAAENILIRFSGAEEPSPVPTPAPTPRPSSCKEGFREVEPGVCVRQIHRHIGPGSPPARDFEFELCYTGAITYCNTGYLDCTERDAEGNFTCRFRLNLPPLVPNINCQITATPGDGDGTTIECTGPDPADIFKKKKFTLHIEYQPDGTICIEFNGEVHCDDKGEIDNMPFLPELIPLLPGFPKPKLPENSEIIVSD